MAINMENVFQIHQDEDEVCKISQNDQTLWERAISITSNKDDEITFRSTRNANKNLLDFSAVQNGYHLDSTTGLPVSYSIATRCCTMNPINVADVDNVTLSYVFTGSGQIHWMYSLFNGSTLLERVMSKDSGDSISMTVNGVHADKMYVCWYNQNKSYITEAMLNGGTTPLPYEQKWNTLPELNAYGGTEKRKQEKLWGRYLPIQTLVPATYPMKDSQGRIAVQDIGIDGTKTNTYGYYNEATNTFTQVSDMTGSALELIDHIEATGEQYILPNLTGNVEWKLVAQGEKQFGTQVLVCSSQTAADGTYVGEFGSYGKWGIGDEIPSTVDIETKATIDINFTSSSQYGTINGESVAHTTSAVHNTWALMGTSIGDYCFNGKLFSAQAIQNNVIVRDYIPIKAGAVYCLLDKVNWEIVGSASGTGFNGSSAVIIPDDIISNSGAIKWDGSKIITEGTQEKITVSGKNLFDTSKDVLTRFPSDISNLVHENGEISFTNTSSVATEYVGTYFEAEIGKTYTITYQVNGSNIYCALYQSDIILTEVGTNYGANTFNGASFQATSKYIYVWIKIGADNNGGLSNIQIEEGSTATTYEPYVTPAISNVEMLNKIGTYEDIQNVTTGGITKNVGIKVLDGTENWNYQHADQAYKHFQINNFLPEAVSPIKGGIEFICSHYIKSTWGGMLSSSDGKICLHDSNIGDTSICIGDFRFSSKDDFKDFLAGQYTKGTPVIIVYPLATPTTETVTAQPITVNKGTYNARVTEASLDNLNIQAKYLGN